MKKILIIASAILFMTSCSSESQDKHLRYNNIVILSDMSSLFKNEPQKDLDKIQGIIQYFKDTCVMPGEKIGDKSSLSFSTFSNNDIISVDISKIKNLGEKQCFINSTGKYKYNGFDQKIAEFEQKIRKTYDDAEDEGLDLISLLLEKIKNTSLLKGKTFFSDGINTTNISYDNHIYIFTDGYLEYKGNSKNNQFYYGNLDIRKVREYCIKYKVDIDQALESNVSFCLPVTQNVKDQEITLHIMETHERDKNAKFLTYNNPIGQRDNEILEAVWKKWANESGFVDLIWEKY